MLNLLENAERHESKKFWTEFQSESKNAQPTVTEPVINPSADAAVEPVGEAEEIHGQEFNLDINEAVADAVSLPSPQSYHTLKKMVFFPQGKWEAIIGVLRLHPYEAVSKPLKNAKGAEREAEAVTVLIRSMALALELGIYPQSKSHVLLPTGLYDLKIGEALCVVLAKSKLRCPLRLEGFATVPFPDDVVMGSLGGCKFPTTGVLHISDETIGLVVDNQNPIAVSDANIAVRRAFSKAKMHPKYAQACWLWRQQQHGWRMWVPEIKKHMIVCFSNPDRRGKKHYSLYQMV